MRIIFLVPVVPPVINGIGEYTLHLVRNLRQSGMDAHILTSTGQTPEEPWIHACIKKWTQKEIAEQTAPLKPDWVSLQYVPQLYHAKGLCWNISGVPAYLKKSLGCKVTVTFHEFTCGWEFNPKKILLAIVYRMQTRRLLLGADFAVTTCESYREKLESLAKGTAVHHIPVGANILPQTNTAEQILALKTRLGFRQGVIFSVFGRLSNFRNHKLALKVLEQARAHNIPAFLILIGCMRTSNPDFFSELMQNAEKKNLRSFVVETGDLSAREVSLYLSLTDVFLFPQTDGVSTRNTTVMSAMAHGLPIVSFVPSKGNFEGESIPYGALAPQENESAFIEKALHFASQKTDDQKKQDQIAYYETRFSWKFISMRYLTLMTAP